VHVAKAFFIPPANLVPVRKHIQPDSDQDKRNDEPSVALDSRSESPVAGQIITEEAPERSHHSEDKRIERNERSVHRKQRNVYAEIISTVRHCQERDKNDFRGRPSEPEIFFTDKIGPISGRQTGIRSSGEEFPEAIDAKEQRSQTKETNPFARNRNGKYRRQNADRHQERHAEELADDDRDCPEFGVDK
jgi:hypothetical protein